jgi:T4-like virus tail tube protein gp19
MPITQDKRDYTAGKYGLELDGLSAGWVQSASGGYAVADVVEEKLGADQVVHKHIAALKYADLELACGTGMSAGFYQWIKDSLDHRHARKNGALVTMSYDFKETERLTFQNALISAVGFPALDGASKEAARLTVRLSPEYTRPEKPSGVKLTAKYDSKMQKKWLPADFKLAIDGLVCTAVNRIEPLVIGVAIVENPVGELRDYEKEPAHLEVPDLVVTLSESQAETFFNWHEDFLIKGNNGEDREKSGTLQLMTPNLRETLFTLSFSGLGIYKLARAEQAAGSDAIRRVTASMYCQTISFSVGAGTAGAEATAAATTGATASAVGEPAAANGQSAPNGAETTSPSETGSMILAGEYPGRFTRLRTMG